MFFFDDIGSVSSKIYECDWCAKKLGLYKKEKEYLIKVKEAREVNRFELDSLCLPVRRLDVKWNRNTDSNVNICIILNDLQASVQTWQGSN